MTYSELGYLRMLFDAVSNECATEDERAVVEGVFVAVCKRLKIAQETAEVFLETLRAG